MVVRLSSGVGDVERISEIGTSHSVVPTLYGPNGFGMAGTGLNCGSMVIEADAANYAWSRARNERRQTVYALVVNMRQGKWHYHFGLEAKNFEAHVE
jgi:hypothetical protein